MPKLTNGTANAGHRDNVYQRGERWYVRFMHEGQEVRRSAGRSKAAAQLLLAQLRDKAERGTLGRAKRSTDTLESATADYLDWAKAHKRSWKRDELSLRILAPKLGHFKLGDLDKSRIEAYQRDRLREGVTPATCNREIACLRKLLNHAVEVGDLEANPLRGVKMLPEAEARVPVLSVDDERKLLDTAARISPWLAPFLRVALATGARAGELTALLWRHVDFDEGEIVIEQSKGGTPRRVPVSRAVLAELKESRRQRERAGDEADAETGVTVSDLERRRKILEAPVFTSATGGPVSVWNVSQAFKRLARKIGKGELRLHDLRHVAATKFLGQGRASLPEVATLLGQKTLIMARRYAHATKARLRSIVEDAADPVAPSGDKAKGEGDA